MANSTINFNPARFAGGVAKSFVSATAQTIAHYMPFTSEVLSDASDQIFNVKEFINENRPDRRSRNDNNILKTLTNNAFNASKMIVSDLSYGDLSFEDSRNMIGNYLSKHAKSEFDFGFDDDFGDDGDYDFEGDFDDNSAHLEEKGFTVEDFAEGIHASTTATVNAIETSYRNTAIANAKSNNILGDRLIASNLATTAQTMQAFDVINKNVSGINANLANIVEYNNTTMNDFIQNTLTHFNKVEQFMDKMTQRFAKEEEQPKKKESTKIFEGTRINFGNLFSKATYLADEKFAGNSGAVPFAVRLLGSMMFGEKLPKWIEDLNTATDFGDMLKYFNPMTTVIEKLFPELGKLKRLDAVNKAFVGSIREKISSRMPDNKIGEFIKELLKDEDDDLAYRSYKNKEASWTTSDSAVLQSVIPTVLGEANNELHTINSQVSNIVKLLENNAKISAAMHESLGNFHSDSLKYFANTSKGDKRYFKDASKSVRERTAASKKMFAKHRNQYRGVRLQNAVDNEDYKNEHSLVFNSETGRLESAKSIYDASIDRQIRAQMTGSDVVAQQVNAMIYMDGTLKTDEDLIERYSINQLKLDVYKKAMEEVQKAIWSRNNRIGTISYDVGEGDKIEIDIDMYLNNIYKSDGSMNPMEYYKMIEEIAEKFDIEFAESNKKFNRIRIINSIREANVMRKEAIRNNEQRYLDNITEQHAEKQYLGKNYDQFAYTTVERIHDSGRNIDSSSLKVQSGDAMMMALVEGGYLEEASNAYGISKSEAKNFLEQRRNAGDAYATQLIEKMEKALQETDKGLSNIHQIGEATDKLGNNIANIFIGGLLHPFVDGIETFTDEYITGDDSLLSNIKEALSGFSLSEFKTNVEEYIEKRKEGPQLYYDENGEVRAHWRPGKEWGWKEFIAPDPDNPGHGMIIKEEEDDDFRRIINAANDDKKYNWIIDYDARQIYRIDDTANSTLYPNGKKILYPEQYHFKQFATGATRIDKDQLVQVHEGEMILDKALSEDVRAQFANVLNNGGFDKMTDDQRKQLISAIEASNDAFKDRGEQTLNDILNETRKHDLNGTVDLSDESVCIIPINKDDSPASVIMKTLSEMATNTRIMLAGAIGSASVEDAENASGNVKSGFSKLFGSYDKEAKKLKGGMFTESANKFIDDMQYWAFKNIGGFSYTGTMRDEYGNPIEGDKQYFKNGEDNPETISKKFINMITERAEIAMDQMGLSSDEKNKYIGSIKNLIGGTKGAGKGWITGLAASGFLGLSAVPALGFLVPAIGAIAGFGLSNKDNSNLIFGAEATDSDGRKYRYGGLFSDFINKFAELGDDVKTNFKTTFAEIGKNLRDATTMFVDNLIHKDKPTMLGKITTGIKDAIYSVTAKTTEFAVDAANIGVRLALNAAKIPFDAVAGIIGGKAYRKAKRHEKWAAKDTEVKNIVKEFALYQRATGGVAGNFLAGAAEWDLKATQNVRGNLAIMGGLLSHGYDNLNNKFMGVQDRAKSGAKSVLEKISEGLSTFHKETGIGIKALLQMVPTALFVASGNIPAALATAGFNIGNIAMENLLGTGLIPLLARGIQLTGTKIGSKFKRAKESAGTAIHSLKRRLGMRDGKFYLKRMNSSVGMEEANVLSELDIDPDLQDKYYEWIKNGRDESQITQDELEQFRMIDSSVRTGLSSKNQDELKQLKADEDLYKQLKKKKNLTPEEKQKLKELKLGKIDRRGRIGELNYKAEQFHASHDINAENYRDLLDRNAQNRDQYKAALQFKDTLFAGKLTKDMFIDGENMSDDELAKRQKDYDDERTKLRKQILKKFGNTADWELHQDEIKEMIMNNEYVGKSAAALKDKSMDDIKKFVLGNAYTDETIKKGEELEQKFKDRITGDGDSIFSFVKQTKEDLKNMLELFKTWINTEKKEEPIGDKTSDLGEGSSRSEVAEMYGFDVNKLKNGDEAEKARFAKAQADGDLPVDIINAVTQAVAGHDEVTEEDYNQYASGATNIPHDQVAKLHAGEAVLDAETAKSFRSGAFGGGGILADTMASIKNGIGDLVSVFKGDEHGSADAKKSFLDKMKESFSGVGKTITGAVFGSGLIPLDPLTGQPDIAKIGARLIALLGGVLVLGPIIGKVAQALKPIFEPLIEGIKTAVTSAVATVKDVIYDMAGVNSFDELIMKMGAYIHEGWKKIGEYKASQSINKSDTEFKNDKTVEHNYANRKSIEGNIKSSGSDMNFAQYSEFCNGCQRYYEAIKEFGKFVAKESSEIQGNTISKVTAMGGATGYVLGLVSTATAKFNKPTGILSKAIESQLTSSEKSFITNHVTRNSEFFLGALTGNFYAFEGTLMSDFCQVITSETGIGVKYEDNAYIADTKVSAAKIQRGIEIINTRIGILNKLRNSGGASTNYFADQFKSQVAARNSEINATVPAPTTSGGGNSEEKPAGGGIGYGYTQNDPRWSSMGYGRFKSGRASTMGSGGCGPTAMSNVYTQLTGRTINPAQMARFSQANGYNAQGGTSAGLFTSGARKLGLSSRAIGKNGSAIGRSVMNGNGVIIAGKNGPYTRAGHIMSVRGVDGFGNAIVDDPLRRGARRIPMNKLTKGMTHAWSIGNGEATGIGGQPHSYWDDEFTDGTITFNPNGGAFGFTDKLFEGCVYNSFVNAYLNSLLKDGESFSSLAQVISPVTLRDKYPGIANSKGHVESYDKLYNALNSFFEGSDHPKYDFKWDIGGPDWYNTIYENLKVGNPMLFSSNSGNSTKMEKIISWDATSKHDNNLHSVMLAGLYYDKDGNEYVIVDNNNTGKAKSDGKSNQIVKVPIDYFRNAVTTATGSDIHRIVIFDRKGVQKGINLEDKFNNLRKASLDKNNPNANKYREEFINTFGFEPEKYNSYQEYIKSTSPTQSGTNGTYSGLTSTGSPDLFTNGLSSNTSGSNVTSIGNWQIPADLLEHRSHTNFVEYIADIAGRLAQLGSNILGSLISGGDTSGLTKGPSSGVGFAGGTHGGGGGGGVRNTSVSITGTPIDSAGQSIDGYTAPMSSLAAYNALPDWAKTSLNDVTFFANPGIPDFENAINYSATVTPIGETSVQFPPKNYSQLEKMYFHIYNDGDKDNRLPSFGRSGFHFGSDGGYPGDAVFNKLMHHPDPNVVAEATKYYDYVKKNLRNFSDKGESITGSKEFLNALIQAEDAANIELKSNYFNRIYKANSGITDPRIYALGGDILCIRPKKSTLLTGVNDLDTARAKLHGVADWAGPRVDGVYGLITSGTGKINGTTWNMQPYSIGGGDAGYAMRDNNYRYTDDIYMGDADHPMNVTMDNTPVTTRLDKLIYLLDSAVNYNETPKSGPSNAKSLGNGDGDKAVKKQQPTRSSKGETSVGAHDRLATIHNKIAKRTRVGLNYNQL